MYGIFFVIGLLFVGIISSYTDIKYGKIKNKVLFVGIIYALLLNVIIYFTINDVNPRAYFHYFTNSIFMLVLGFILWNIGLWTAGDAKLFFVFNLLTPPFFITEYYLGYFYGFLYFINIFGVMFFFFLYKIFTKISMKEFLDSIKKTFKLKEILQIFLFVFAFGFLMRYFPNFFTSNFFITILTFFALYSIIEFFLGDKMMIFIYILAVIRIISQWSDILKGQFWLQLFVQLLMIVLLRFLLLRLSYYAFTNKLRIHELKKGMFLAEDIIPVNYIEQDEKRRKIMNLDEKGNKKYFKMQLENLTFISYLKDFYFKHIDYNKNLGLSKENLEWFSKNKKDFLFRSLRVYETMPFAPLIFIGFLVTLIIKGNIFRQLTLLILNLLGINIG
jgi:Flp pilus assembly protein protease CpaA